LAPVVGVFSVHCIPWYKGLYKPCKLKLINESEKREKSVSHYYFISNPSYR
jgi:hypothetical protein